MSLLIKDLNQLTLKHLCSGGIRCTVEYHDTLGLIIFFHDDIDRTNVYWNRAKNTSLDFILLSSRFVIDAGGPRSFSNRAFINSNLFTVLK